MGGLSLSRNFTTMKKKKRKSPNRVTILKDIFDDLCMIVQWEGMKNCPENVVEYHYRAQAMIELLEVHDCGSTGGYDTNQPTARNIFDRWDWLVKKYHKLEDITPKHEYERIKKYYYPPKEEE